MTKRILPLLVLAGLLTAASPKASPITVGPTKIENSYPQSIHFVASISSTAAQVTRVELHLTLRGDTTTMTIVVPVEPAPKVTARAVWETRDQGVPPGAPFTYRWFVRDEAGNTLTTPEQAGLVLDPRREWKSIVDKQLGVWWYEGDQAFGKVIYHMALDELRSMEAESGLHAPYRLHIVIYPDETDFAEWHNYVQEWVGGEAYTSMGLTVQIVPEHSASVWLKRIICHEVAHLYFYQATHNPRYTPPQTWMVEGYAGYQECTARGHDLGVLQEAARNGTLIPLRLVTGSFGSDPERVDLLYEESWSAVKFIYDRWSGEGMGRVLQAFHDGADTSDALEEALVLDFEAFQEAWWEWLGGAPGGYPAAPPPAPTVTPWSTRPQASLTPTMGPMVAVTPIVAEPAITQTPTPWSGRGATQVPCLVGAGVMGVVGVVTMVARPKRGR